MRLLFLGSGEFGLPTLEHLHAAGVVAAVVTQPDRPAGRHRHLTPTPVGQWAQAMGLPLIKAPDVNAPGVLEQMRGLAPDAAVVIAFGQKLGPELIATLGRLAINLHASLLPRFRGAAPINWAIIQGEPETGLSVIGLAQRMDAGLIYAQARTAIDPKETAGELHDRLAALGPDLVRSVLQDFQAGRLEGRPQDESMATRAPKLSRQDAWVDFKAAATTVVARIHGLTPWPAVSVRWEPSAAAGDGAPQHLDRTLILRRAIARTDNSASNESKGRLIPGTVLENHGVAVGDGEIQLLEVQVPGGRPMAFQEFVRGHRLLSGDRLVGAGPELSAHP